MARSFISNYINYPSLSDKKLDFMIYLCVSYKSTIYFLIPIGSIILFSVLFMITDYGLYILRLLLLQEYIIFVKLVFTRSV